MSLRKLMDEFTLVDCPRLLEVEVMASALRNVARSKLRIAMIPADGIGREVLPARTSAQCDRVLHILTTISQFLQAARRALEALGSLIPRPEFTHLDAGFEHFTKKGTALPEGTLE